MAVPFHPPSAIIGYCRLVFDLVIKTSEKGCGYREERQQDGGKSGLKFAVHSSRFTDWDGCRDDAARQSTPLRYQQLHCHPPVLVSRFHRATSTIIERIQDIGYELWNIASAFWDPI